MSTNAYGDDKGATSGGTAAAGALQSAQAPRLRSAAGSYAAWKPDMDVYLERIGADGVHKRTLTDANWTRLSLQVQSWSDEALALALASIGVDDTSNVDQQATATSSSASASTTASHSLTIEQKETRRLVTALVERSRRVFGIIWASLPEELRAQAVHVPQGFASGLWQWLQQKFQNTEQDSVGELLAQWVALRQEEDESFDAYRARVNQLGALLEHAKEPQSTRMRIFTLLDKLQPRYKQAVLALKAGGQLKDADAITWDAVTAFINQHERSELRLGTESNHDGVAVAATARGSGVDFSGKHAQVRSDSGSGRSSKRGGHSHRVTHGSGQPRHSVETRKCFRCDQQGHLAANCLNPPKAASSEGGSQPGKRSSEQALAATAGSSNRYGALSDDDSCSGVVSDNERSFMSVKTVPTFAEVVTRGRAHCSTQSAATMQQAAAVRQPTSSSVTSKSPTPLVQPAARSTVVTVSLDVALADDAWGWDTMASACCSGNRERFATLRDCPAVSVKMADGSMVKVTRIGSVPLRVTTDSGKVVRVMLDNVLFDKRFASNLLSGELLTKKLGWEFHSTPDGTYAVTPGGHRVTLSTRGRVAVLMTASPERVFRALVPGVGVDHDDAADQLVRLHERLCHMGWVRMMNLIHSGRVDDHGIDVKTLSEHSLRTAEKRVRDCIACIKGRATRTAFGHRGLDRGTTAGECIHLDTYQVKVERDGRAVVEHGLVMKDMYSGYVWHSRLLSKDEVADRVIRHVVQAETQFGCMVKRIYTDGGTEFINHKLKEFCAKHGKQLHWTPARSQQLNGASERTVRTFKDYERMMTQHAGAPVKLWGHAGSHAAFVWNRAHIASDTRTTPYEALRGKKPSLKHLSVWGCDAFCHVPKEQRTALAAKAEPCIYLGHNEAQNAANVLLLSTKMVICTRDVTYRSGSFEFMRAIQRGDSAIRDALEASNADIRAELDDGTAIDGRPKEAPAQGGLEAAAPDSSDAADAAAEKEWTVESIVAQRQCHGRTEYKVRWAGYDSDEDSWESEADVNELEALDIWKAKRAAPQQLRRSTRYGGHASDDPKRAQRYDEGGSDDEEPQVHMAMCALRSLQLPDEQPDSAMLMSAVASGIAALEQQTPRTFREAMASPDRAKWQAALNKEMRSCVEQKVWTLVRRDSLPKGTNVLPCKEVFKLKLNEYGVVVEHKARFTPKGFRQKKGVDFFETYARTGQYKTLRVALSLVAKWDHELAQFDVPTAFLNAAVDEDIYMQLPEGYEQPGMVCKLQKSLYGLKQAPRNWDRLVHTFITADMAFRATVSDPSLYYKRSRSGRVMMIYRFVDDMQGSFHSDDRAEFQESVALLQKRFNIKKMDTATWMLGMRITRDRKARTITLDQELYISKALERYGLQQCRPVSTPEAVGALRDSNPALDQPTDTQRYMEMTGTLMYAAISTRPDIAHAVHYLASNMQLPTRRHMQAAERVLRYLSGTKEVGLVFGSRNGDIAGDSRGRKANVQVDVCAFADADWANDKGDRRSISGWVAKLNGDPVSWSSKKQRVVALSTCEAELYAEAAAIQEVLWLRGLMEEMGLHTQTGATVYGDNQSAIAVSENGVKGERTKHVDVKYHFVTEAVERGVIKLRWVPTTQQQADVFTKALAAPVFELLRRQLMTR
jgi:transposase InsO family protein